MPLDHPRPPLQRGDTAKATVAQINGETAQLLRLLCRTAAATLNVGLLASWGAYLARLSGTDAVILSQPHSLRHDERLSGLIGYFHTVLAFVYTHISTDGITSVHIAFL